MRIVSDAGADADAVAVALVCAETGIVGGTASCCGCDGGVGFDAASGSAYRAIMMSWWLSNKFQR